MATIPDYSGRQVRSQGLPGNGFSMRGPDASGLTRGLAQVEESILRESERAREEAETTQTKEAAMARDQFEQDLLFNQETGLYTRKGKNAQDITNQGLSALDKKYEEISAGIKNERVRKRFADYHAGRRLRLTEDLNRYEFQQNEAYKDQVDNGLLETTMQGAALHYGNPTKVAEAQAQVQALLRARAQRKGIADEQLQADILQTNSGMLTGVIQRLASDDPYKAREYFQSQQGGMTADDQVRVSGMIDREIRSREVEARQMQAISRAELSSRISDATSAYLSGFDYDSPPSQAEFIAAYGSEEGGERFQQFQKTQGLGNAIREMATADPEERANLIEKFNPVRDGVATDGFQADAKLYGTLINAASRLGRELQEDPAAYVVSRAPLVQRAAQALDSGDPAAAAAYADASMAEQRRLGVPEPKLLTEQQAAAIAAGFSRTEDGGSNAANLVQQLQDQWGQHWPTVFRQLQGKLPGAALVIGTGVDQQTAATLARIAPIKTEDLKAGLPGSDTKAARDVLGESMAEFRATLTGQVGGERTFSTLYGEMERLTYAYMGQGKSAEEAAEQAYKSVIDDRYTLKGTWRAPKQLDADLIESGAERAVRSLDADDIEFAKVPGVSEDFARIRVKKNLENEGYWVTLPDESGLALHWDGAAVLDKNGRPITRGWDDLAGEAVVPKGKNAFELRRNATEGQ